jgi:hypothetical protein
VSASAEVPRALDSLVADTVRAFRSSGRRLSEFRSYLSGQWQVAASRNPELRRELRHVYGERAASEADRRRPEVRRDPRSDRRVLQRPWQGRQRMKTPAFLSSLIERFRPRADAAPAASPPTAPERYECEGCPPLCVCRGWASTPNSRCGMCQGGVHLVMEAELLEASHREDELAGLRFTLELRDSALVEASEALEQANNRLALLEEELRGEAAREEQLELMHAPAASEDEPLPAPDPLVHDVVQDEVWALRSIHFKDKRAHWQFDREGEKSIAVPVPDDAFLKSLHKRQVSFADGDVLLLSMRVQTYTSLRSGKPYTVRSIVKVHRVITPDEQSRIFPAEPQAEVARAR